MVYVPTAIQIIVSVTFNPNTAIGALGTSVDASFIQVYPTTVSKFAETSNPEPLNLGNVG